MADNSRDDTTKHSAPIPINTTRLGRGRSASVSSGSSGSASSPSDVPTPMSSPDNSARIGTSPSSSPIFNYFFSQSPTKPGPGAQTYPFRNFPPPPVYEEEDEGRQPAVFGHARRASNATAGRYPQSQPQPPSGVADTAFERGTGLLRRLSLSSGKPSGLSRSPPNAPPNSTTSPVESQQTSPFARSGRPQRSATISVDSKHRRAPSPMGERILKGHFDGFN